LGDLVQKLKDLVHAIYDVRAIIQTGGLALICGIVFAETGLMIGFFLPGDSLLVTAGILANPQAGGYLSLWSLLFLVTACAIVGDQVGYLSGRKLGPAIFRKEDSLLFRKSHVERAHAFYERYGAKTIVIARFVPIVRTFAPIVAGVAKMNYRTFVVYNVVGGVLWVWSMVLGGYFLLSLTKMIGIDVEHHLHKVILIVVFLSILPGVIEGWREKRRLAAEKTTKPE
jgi:membrane-associated protein